MLLGEGIVQKKVHTDPSESCQYFSPDQMWRTDRQHMPLKYTIPNKQNSKKVNLINLKY